MGNHPAKLLQWRTFISVIAIPATACAAQWALREYVQYFPLLFFWPALYLSTRIGSRRDGILATLVLAALAWWLFMPQEFSLIKTPASYFSALLFIAIGILITYLQWDLKAAQLRIADLLDHSEQSRHLLLESLADGVFVAQDYRFVFSNRALPEMLGYSPEEFANMPFERVIAPQFLELWTKRFEQRVGTEEEPEKYYELQFLHKKGHLIWVELRASRARYNNRLAVLGIIRDVTQRKLHDERLLLSEAVFNSTQEAISVTDLEGNILAVNPAFSTFTEYSEQELLGRNIRILRSGRHGADFYQQMWHSIRHFGEWQGAIWNRRKSGDIYQEWLTINTVRDKQGQPIQYIGISLDLSRSHHVETEMEHMAHHDALTDLPNRLLLHSRLEHTLERAGRDRRQCAVLYLDLDRFKMVNDTLGHAAGDELLKLAATRMKERLRDVDTLARVGGDEFVIVLDGVKNAAQAETIARKLIDYLSIPFTLQNGSEVNIGTSIGIALFPAHGADPIQLIQRADEALYSAKKAGKGTVRFYSPA